MKILNFGSLNIDYVYRVENFVRPGETISASSFNRFRGGKGMNQSVALARAGAAVEHAGRIGKDGLFLRSYLESCGVGCSRIAVSESEPSGHAMIQVSDSGENAIVVCGGANTAIPPEVIRDAFRGMKAGDFLLIQNEISPLEDVIRAGVEKKMRICFNPAPMNDSVKALPMELVDTLIVNRTEAATLAELPLYGGFEPVLCALAAKYPRQNILMTLGSDGSVWLPAGAEKFITIPADYADAVDTTAAGDTYIGFFLAGCAAGLPVEKCMRRASKASAICVSRPGAADSIPYAGEIE